VDRADRLAEIYDRCGDKNTRQGQETIAKRGELSPPAELVALVDSLGNGALNEMQRETVQALREGILSLANREEVRV
jgi:hypothetical protein